MQDKKRKCEKCGEFHYCEAHHILPQKLFGEGEIVWLCPNCHDEYHRSLGYKFLQKINKQSMEFYLEKWFKWLYLATFIGLLGFFIYYTMVKFVFV